MYNRCTNKCKLFRQQTHPQSQGNDCDGNPRNEASGRKHQTPIAGTILCHLKMMIYY